MFWGFIANRSMAMRKIDESRAANYIRKHSNYKKWLAFVLCLSLLTGTVTLYTLNKPATAMTEEGAESLGVVLETASSEDEAELIEQTLENKTEAESDEKSDEDSDDLFSEFADDGDDKSEEYSDVECTEEAEDSSLEDADIEKETEEGEKDSEEKKEISLSTEEKLAKLDVPESVDVAEYVTETIIERKLEDGSWERIDKDDITEGDWIKVTYRYNIPDTAKLSGDIHLDIADELDFIDVEKASLLGSDGSVDISDDNQVKIEYSSEIKNEIIDSAVADDEVDVEGEESDLQAAVNIGGFFKSFFDLMAPVTVYASEGDGVSLEGPAKGAAGSSTDNRFLIDKVLLEKEENGRYIVVAIDDSQEGSTEVQDVSIKNGDSLKFTLNYTVPQNTLDSSTEEGRTVEYQLPGGIKPVQTETGKIRNSFGKTVGTYVLDESGKLTAVFDQFFADQNAEGEITGDFTFEGSADFTDEDQGETIEYDFSNQVVIIIPKKEEQDTSVYDLDITKTGSKSADGSTINYEVTVSSVKGTETAISFIDSLRFYKIDIDNQEVGSTQFRDQAGYQSIQVKIIKHSKDGTTTDISSQIGAHFADKEDGSKTFRYAELNTILPKLDAGEKYVITYDVVVPESMKTTHSRVRNRASGISNKNDDYAFSPDIDFTPNLPNVWKEGAYNGETNSVDWVIHISSNKADLYGYLVEDYIGGKGGTPYNGNAVLYVRGQNWELQKVKDITLPYTFDISTGENENRSYEIHYSTPVAEYATEYQERLENYATVTKDGDGSSGSSSVNVPIAGGVDKKAQGYVLDGSKMTITWKVTIVAPINDKNWVYYDVIENGYITDEELKQLDDRLPRNLVNKGEVKGTEKSEDGKGYTKFEIAFKNPLTENLTFEYKTFGTVDDPNKTYTFKNSGYAINYKRYDSDEVVYEPAVEKYYFSSKSAQDVHTDLHNEDLEEKGILTWGFKVSIPKLTNSRSITITENLPEGVSLYTDSDDTSLYALAVAANKEMNSPSVFDMSGGSGSVNYDGKAEISANVSGNTVTIDVPTGQLNGSTLYFCIRAKIADNLEWDEITDESLNYKEFKNEVVAKDGETIIGKSEHTVWVSNNTHTLEKWSDDPDGGIISYSVDVNKYAANLLPGEGKDTLTLIDTLTGKYQAAPEDIVDISIVPGSVKVQKVDNSTGESTELEAGIDYHLVSSEPLIYRSTDSAEYWNNWYYNLEKIVLEVPDEEHLIVTYEYYIRGTEGISVNVENTAQLKGVTQSSVTDKLEKPVVIEKSSMTGDVNGINLFKVDELDSSVYLEGARFSLYEYDPNCDAEDKYKLVGTEGEFITDKFGTVILKDIATNKIKLNTAYKLVEFAPPTGYEKTEDPYFFMVIDPNAKNDATTTDGVNEESSQSNEQSTSVVAPKGFNGKKLFMGGNIYITNLPINSEIKVIKTWNNPDGTIDDASGQEYIDVDLYRKVGNAKVDGSTYRVTFSSFNPQIQISNNYDEDVPYGSEYTLVASLPFHTFDTVMSGIYSMSQEEFLKGLREKQSVGAVSSVINVTCNDIQIKNAQIEQQYYQRDVTFTYKFVIHGDIDVKASFGFWKTTEGLSFGRTHTGSSEDIKPVHIDEFVEHFQIYKSNNWEWRNEQKTKEDKTPKYPKFYTDPETGLQYYYLYYVKENTTNSYYEVSYINNSGISSGSIGIINTRNEVVGYELPRTGGVGTLPYGVLGLGLTGSAVIGEITMRRRKKKDKDPA